MKKVVIDLYRNELKSSQNIESKYYKINTEFKRRFIGSIYPEKFQFQNKKVRTADINPILHKIAHFTRVNKENKKRDKSHKQDLSRCVDNSIEISNHNIPSSIFLETLFLINLIKLKSSE